MGEKFEKENMMMGWHGNSGRNGKQPEEFAMTSKRRETMETDLDDLGDEDDQCGVGVCRPSFLQKYSGLWTFTIFVGLSSLSSEFLQSYLKSQVPMLQRQFEVQDDTTNWWLYSSEIACIVSVLFLSIFARRVHIPRVLAITSLICGFAGILCIIPFLATKDNLVPGPHVLENETHSVDKFLMLAPGCSGGPKANQASGAAHQRAGALPSTEQTESILMPDFKKLATHAKYPMLVDMAKSMEIDLEALALMDLDEQIRYVTKLPPNVRSMLPQLKVILGANADDYFIRVKAPSSVTDEEERILIPDFHKLTMHPDYAMLVDIAKALKVDLQALAQMDLRDQLEYLDDLPPKMREMLPNLKGFLGPSGDEYFIYVTPPPPDDEKIIVIMDFKKLTTNPNYAMLVKIAQAMAVDLEALAKMDLKGQLEYLDNLPFKTKNLLPNLKGFLGPNPDSYYIEVTPLPETEVIPDFKKMKTHANHLMLVGMGKAMGIDIEALAEMDLDEQLEYLDKLPPTTRAMLPNLKGFLGSNADDYFIHVERSSTVNKKEKKEKKIQIPDFKKLATHPSYPTLVSMSKTFNIDLKALAEMDLNEQIEYLNKLPPRVRSMLPQLKSFLGADADSYFIYVTEAPSSSAEENYDGTSDAQVTTPTTTVAAATGEEEMMLIPDFKKLKTHPKYPMLVKMAKPMNVDLEAAADMEVEDQVDYIMALPQHVRDMLPQLKMMLGDNADSYFISVKAPSIGSVQEQTMQIPNFKKLQTHSKYPMLSKMAKQMDIDLDALAEMDEDDQIEYINKLPSHVRDMLPQLKTVLGENADSYFVEVTVKGHSSSLSAKPEGDSCQTISREMFEGIYANICPFNSGPHVVNSTARVLTPINIGMVLQGIARAPRMAFGVTFLTDNTHGPVTIFHMTILFGITFFGPLISLLVGLLSTTVYITDQDVGFMTFFNPRWLPAWWMGFVIFTVAAVVFSIPLIFFPKKIKKRPPEKFSITESFSIVNYFKGLFKSLIRLIINPLYIFLVLSHLLSAFAWTGIASIIIPYATHQFWLGPMLPGMFIFISFSFCGALGIFIGGILASKFKMSSLGILKFTFALAFGLVIIQILQLGFGCDQPDIDKGQKILTNYTTQSCRCACQCIDHVFMPGCGSDGKMYFSACHAGCTSKGDGVFTDCQCVDDDVQTMKPGYCSVCKFFYPFVIAFCTGGLLVGMQFVPLLVATIRSVKPKDVPLAIGLRTLLFIAAVVLPSPLVYKAIQDAQCLHKLPACGLMDPCALTDIVPLRLKIFGCSLGLESIAALVLLFAFFIAKKISPIYSDDRYSKE